MSCEQSIKEPRIDNSLNRPPLQNTSEHITGPNDNIKIDLVPVLTPSCGYQNILTATDVFSRYMSANPTTNQDAKTVANVFSIIMIIAYNNHFG